MQEIRFKYVKQETYLMTGLIIFSCVRPVNRPVFMECQLVGFEFPAVIILNNKPECFERFVLESYVFSEFLVR